MGKPSKPNFRRSREFLFVLFPKRGGTSNRKLFAYSLQPRPLTANQESIDDANQLALNGLLLFRYLQFSSTYRLISDQSTSR